MAKIVAVTHKERRRDLRRPVNFDGLVNDGRITVVDISSSGVGARGLDKGGSFSAGDEDYELEIRPLDSGKSKDSDLEPGDIAELKVFKEKALVLSIQVEIVRVDKDADSLGARFINIEDGQYRVIEKLVTGRPIKRGKS
jgi:hypothetical protein